MRCADRGWGRATRAFGAFVALSAAACTSLFRHVSAPPPSALVGAFEDDYGTRYRISSQSFAEGRSIYRVIEWHPEEQYLLAQNADSNRTDGGKYSRIDWVMLGDQGDYRWGYCHSAWKAPTLDSARATHVVDRSNPRAGCSRHPFTRMKAVAAAVPHGRIVVDTVHSSALRGNLIGDTPDRSVTIYLPPSYDGSATKRYPVVYLLHGATSDPKEWLDGTYQGLNLSAALDQRAASAEYLVVMPLADNRFGGSFYVNSAAFGGWEDFVSSELVAYVDSHFRTVRSRGQRVLAGQSMGGFGALYLAGRHPDIFGHVYAMSPCCTGFVGDIALGGARWSVESNGWLRAMSMAFAPTSSTVGVDPLPALPFARGADGTMREVASVANRWREFQPLERLMRDPSGYRRLCTIGLEAGAQDAITHVPAGAAAFSRELTRLGIAHVYEEFTGGHVDRTRERFERVVLPFFERALTIDRPRC